MSDARVVRAFDALLEVLAERVPLDPAVELLRAGDIAGFVLLRIPEPRHIAEFAAWWGNLAVRHLAAHDLDEEVRRTRSSRSTSSSATSWTIPACARWIAGSSRSGGCVSFMGTGQWTVSRMRSGR